MAESSTQRPLKIGIVGAGIGGLTAALGLRQQGHEVIVFERSQFLQETGAALHLAPNCHGILRRFGIFPESFGANIVNGIAEYDASGKLNFDMDLSKALSIWQHPWMLSHRIQLHDELKKKAAAIDGTGIPAVIKTSSTVVDVDCTTATITLANGDTFSGDLILGADGVSSATRKFVVGDGIKPFGSGKSAFRFMLSCQQIRDNPVTAYLASRQGRMILWVGNDRRLIMYPCSNNTMMNFVALHPSALSTSRGESWDLDGTKDALLDVYKDFGPVVRSLLEMVSSSGLKAWTLLDMERIPCWVKGRLALLGDAAHPFLPHQGQGAGIAIEDAASLSALLPGNTHQDDIPERLALYEKLRDDRAHKIQEYTRQAGADRDEKPGKFNIMEYTNYNFGHDEWHNSSHALKKLLWSRNGAVHWRSPMSFGPMPSPRQDHYGRAIASQHSRFITHSVRFQTSATYLKTLFPTASFSFAGPGTVAEASFQCTELNKMTWLGGGGYKFFGLWIHGVQYQKKDGTKVFGSFLPVLLETLADPIITGREELGMPKLFCDVEITKENATTTIGCSWRGAKFIEIKMNGLAEQSSERSSNTDAPLTAAAPEDGLLVYRHVPAVGKPGTADAEYPVIIRNGLSTTPRVVERVLRGTDSTIECMDGDWETLPTLHHVASGFANVPIFKVIESKTEEGHGVEDLSQAERLE